MVDKINNVTREMFIAIVKETQTFLVTVIKIENAFGGIVLDCLGEYPTAIIDTLEKELGVTFTDEILDMIYCVDEDNLVPAEDIWKIIEEIYNENR